MAIPKTNNLNYYLQLPYTIQITPPAEPGQDWFAQVVELRGCMTQAPTRDEVLLRIEEAKQLWLEDAIADGESIPEPSI